MFLNDEAWRCSGELHCFKVENFLDSSNYRAMINNKKIKILDPDTIDSMYYLQ